MSFKPLERFHPQKGQQSIAELFPWRLLVTDNIVALSDGGWIAAWEFIGPNPEATSIDDVRGYAKQINTWLLSCGEGWQINVDCARLPSTRYPDLLAPVDPLTAILDEERRAFFNSTGNHYETKTYISLSYHPRIPQKKTEKNIEWMYEEGGLAAKQIQVFQSKLNEFVAMLRAIGNVRRLGEIEETVLIDGTIEPIKFKNNELLSFFYYCITGKFQPVVAPAKTNNSTFAANFALHETIFGQKMTIDADTMYIVRVPSLPDEASPAMLLPFINLQTPYRLSMRYLPMPINKSYEHAEGVMKKQEIASVPIWKMLFSKMGNSNPTPSRQNVVRMKEAEHIAARVEDREIALAHLTVSFIVSDPDEANAESRAQYIVDALQSRGITANFARYDSQDMYQASLPGDRTAKVTPSLVTTAYAAYTIPTVSTWSGVKKHPSDFYPPNVATHLQVESPSKTPLRLALHWNTAGHTLVVGAQRSGKTVLLKRILTQHMTVPQARAFIFDRDNSMNLITSEWERLGIAAHYDISSASFAPLSYIDRSQDDFEEAMGFVEFLCICYKYDVDESLRADITHALTLASSTPIDQRSLSCLVNYTTNTALQEVIRYYTNAQTGIGRLFNGTSDPSMDRRVIVVETSNFLSLLTDEKNVLPVYRYLLMLVMRLAKARAPMGVWVDEASVYLRNPILASYFFDILRRWGKMNVFGIFATQGANDITNAGDLGQALIQECKTQIYAGDRSASKPAMIKTLMELGLSEQECHLIASNAEHRYYYYTSPLGQAVFALALQKIELACYTQDEAKFATHVKELQRQYPNQWLVKHFQEQNVGEDWIRLYERYTQ